MSYVEASERLWLRVRQGAPDECWEWLGALNSHGYGTIREHSRSVGCHVLAYRTRIDAVPKGSVVMHKCDNRKCCNPSHLVLGTHLLNARDRVAKGRSNSARGTQCGQARMTDFDVALMRYLVECGARQRPFVSLFGVTPMAVNRAVRRKTWRHVADLPGPGGES